MPKHVEKGKLYWRRLLSLISIMLNPDNVGAHIPVRPTYEITTLMSPDLNAETLAEISTSRGGMLSTTGQFRSMFPQIDLLRMSHEWFRLHPTTAKIVNAFNTLPLKVTGRIEDKKDLAAVIAALEELEAYLFSTIPELSDSDLGKGEDIKSLGENSLVKFAEVLEPLPPYSPEPRPLRNKERVQFKFATFVAWVFGLFAHENLLLKFVAWWFLVQMLVGSFMVIIWHYFPNLKLDSTLVSLLIGTPLVVSAAALASPLRKK
jgi:hypothetical protein